MFTTTCVSFIAIACAVYAPVGKGQHRVLRLVQFLIFFKFPKTPLACLQQLVNISSQSDEWCVLLVGQHRVPQLV